MGLKRQKAVRGRAEFARQANGGLEDLQCNYQRRSQGGTLVHVLPVVGVIFFTNFCWSIAKLLLMAVLMMILF